MQEIESSGTFEDLLLYQSAITRPVLMQYERVAMVLVLGQPQEPTAADSSMFQLTDLLYCQVRSCHNVLSVTFVHHSDSRTCTIGMLCSVLLCSGQELT